MFDKGGEFLESAIRNAVRKPSKTKEGKSATWGKKVTPGKDKENRKDRMKR
jgi:hypothetical protein